MSGIMHSLFLSFVFILFLSAPSSRSHKTIASSPLRAFVAFFSFPLLFSLRIQNFARLSRVDFHTSFSLYACYFQNYTYSHNILYDHFISLHLISFHLALCLRVSYLLIESIFAFSLFLFVVATSYATYISESDSISPSMSSCMCSIISAKRSSVLYRACDNSGVSV